MPRHFGDGSDQIFGNGTFDYISASASLERLTGHLAVFVLAEYQNLAGGEHASHLTRGFKAIKPWHAYVHHDQVWFQLTSLLQGVLTVDGFAANLPASLFGK